VKHYFIVGFFVGVGMSVTTVGYAFAKSKGLPLP
jgi:hypothetical protein